MLKNLLFLLIISGLFACAQTVETLNSPAIWLESSGSELAVLDAAGQTYLFDGASLTSLEHAPLASKELVTCQNDWLGVTKTNQLIFLKSGISSRSEVASFAVAACLEDGHAAALSKDASVLHLFDEDLNSVNEVFVAALPDAELGLADLTGDSAKEIVLLTDPTTRYTHAVLGDNLEAASLQVFDSKTLTLLGSYMLSERFVFEQRRVTAFQLENGKEGVLATRSSNKNGAGVILLGFENDKLELLAEAPPIGLGFRWLNLFASQNAKAYAIRTPHIGGPLQRYTLKEDQLEIESFQLGVTNHTIGERNLDLGIMLPNSTAKINSFALPAQRLNTIGLITCENECSVTQSFELNGRLTSNLSYLEIDDSLFVVAADTTGNIYSFLVQ